MRTYEMANNRNTDGRPIPQEGQSRIATRSELLAPDWTVGSAPMPINQALEDIRGNFSNFHEMVDRRIARQRDDNPERDDIQLGDSASTIGMSDISCSSYSSEKHHRLATRVVELMDDQGALKKGGRHEASARTQLRDSIAAILSDDKRRRQAAVKELELIKQARASGANPPTHPGDKRIVEGSPISIPPAVTKTYPPLPAIVEEGRPDPKPPVDHIKIPIRTDDPLYAERVRLQLARMTMQANGARLAIPDQGIRFDGFTPYIVEPVGSPGRHRHPADDTEADVSRVHYQPMGPSVSQAHIEVDSVPQKTGNSGWGEYYDGDNPYGTTVVTRPRVGFSDPISGASTGPGYDVGRISVIRDLAGANTPEGEFLDQKSNELRELIQSELAKKIPGVTGPDGKVKPPKILTPTDNKYSGDEESRRFMQILMGQLAYFAGNWLTSDQHDSIRVHVLQQALTGRALGWYNDNVLRDRIRRSVTWKYADVVVALYEHFVHPRLIEDREKELDAIEYRFTETEGVYEFYQKMANACGEMIHPLSTSEFCKRLFDGLPIDIRRHLAEKRVDPNYCGAKAIVTEAARWEKSTRILRESENRMAKSRGSHLSNGRTTARIGVSSVAPRPSPTGTAAGGKTTPTPPGVNRPFSRNPLTCFECKKEGHRQAECPERSGNKGKRETVSFRAVSDETNGDATTADDGNEPDSADNLYDPDADGPSWYDRGQADDGDEERLGLMREAEDELEDEFMGALRTCEEEEYLAALDDTLTPSAPLDSPIEEHMAAAHADFIERPIRTRAERACLVVELLVNGVKAITLWDTGCTMDSISPGFIEAVKIQTGVLRQPIPLQLGTVGSRSQIHRGARASIELGHFKDPAYYFDISNVAKYDAVLGIPFMRKHGVITNPRDDTLQFADGRVVQAFKESDEAIVLARRAAMRRADGGDRE